MKKTIIKLNQSFDKLKKESLLWGMIVAFALAFPGIILMNANHSLLILAGFLYLIIVILIRISWVCYWVRLPGE